jgi:cytochrome P450
VIFS